MDFAEAKATQDRLYAEVDRAGAELRAFSLGQMAPMGLTPDAVKFSPARQAAKLAYDAAFDALRTFNEPFTKTFTKELRHERRASSRLPPSNVRWLTKAEHDEVHSRADV